MEPDDNVYMYAFLESMRATESKLLSINPDDLNAEQRNELADQLGTCNAVIREIEEQELSQIAEQFSESEEALVEAVSRVESDLSGIQSAVETVATVAAIFATIEDVIGALKPV